MDTEGVDQIQYRIAVAAEQASAVASDKIERIQLVTQRTKLLAINALIEAAHAQERGKGFAVVAQEVANVSDEIKQLSTALAEELSPQLQNLDVLGKQLVELARGSRLAELSHNMIEIIDRNLYERSCDVRWWATDSAVVDSCGSLDLGAAAYASKRLGVILDSYTVYLDLWIADEHGTVIASGRPDRYRQVVGSDVSQESWFQRAMASRSGDEYVVDDISSNPRLKGALVATYATAVREQGESHGRPVGALGIFFDWQPQAGAVVDGVSLSPGERQRTRSMLVDSDHRVIASSDGQGILTERYPLQTAGDRMGYYANGDNVVGYSRTSGYETYPGLGWYGVVEQTTPTFDAA